MQRTRGGRFGRKGREPLAQGKRSAALGPRAETMLKLCRGATDAARQTSSPVRLLSATQPASRFHSFLALFRFAPLSLEWPSRITLNKRRKSAPRDLTQAIRELSRMMRSLGDDNRPGGEKPA